ncbi:MAG: MbcA/ParS/Xre antitoxin family protein [Pseudomonas sp.]|uniref:MbcA/ParS/Xre antitoxin family protein n=1 Tax=Pseudomonas sp. TaxID=306 RepID=UPI000F9209BD
MDRIERVWLQAEQVFGDKAKAAVWLRLPKAGFDGCSALELAREKAGYQRVVEELRRIEHGYAC